MIARRIVTLAVKELLEDVTGKPVGIGSVPIDPATGKPFPPPYNLLYSLGWTTFGSPLADLREDAVATYQVTSVSGPDPAKVDSRGTVEQVEWLADKTRIGVYARPASDRGYVNPLNIPGVTCTLREPDAEPGATDAPEDAIITYVQRIKFHLTASA